MQDEVRELGAVSQSCEEGNEFPLHLGDIS
jgi:hypothetical protein